MNGINAGGTPPTVGVVGLGRMGAPIAERLSTSFLTRVFDIVPHRGTAEADTIRAKTIPDLARQSDLFVTILPGAPELQECMDDSWSSLRPGTLWVDLTSGDPAVTRVLAAQAKRYDVDVVSAPMGGSVREAHTGELTFFVSGAESAVARVLPLLRVLSGPDGVRRAGTRAEDGQIVKLLANGLWFAQAIAASEALLIGQGLGLAVRDLRDLLRDSAGGSFFLDEHSESLLGGDYLETFGIDRVVDELDAIAAMARSVDVPIPVLDASARLHRQALDLFGPALGELLAVKLLEEQSGQRLRR